MFRSEKTGGSCGRETYIDEEEKLAGYCKKIGIESRKAQFFEDKTEIRARRIGRYVRSKSNLESNQHNTLSKIYNLTYDVCWPKIIITERFPQTF